MKISPMMIESGVAALARIKKQHPVDESIVAAVFSAMHSAMQAEQKRAAGVVTTKPYEHQAWPAWRYGPDGEAMVFDKSEDVPEGWTDQISAGLDNALAHAKRRPGRPPKVKTDASPTVA